MLGRRRSLGATMGGFESMPPAIREPQIRAKKRLRKRDRNLKRLRSTSDIFSMISPRGKPDDNSPPKTPPVKRGGSMISKVSPPLKTASSPTMATVDTSLDLTSAVNKKKLQLMELKFEEDRLRRSKDQHLQDISQYKALKRVQKAKGTTVKFLAAESDIEVCELLSISSIKSNEVYSCNVGGFRLALKKLASSRANARDIQSFINEIDIMSNLPANKHLVRYAFHMLYQGEMCLFMELRAGTLRDHLDSLVRSKGSLFPDLAVRLALQVAQGLECLHKNNVIHRDVKAENVFVNFGPGGTVSSSVLGDYDVSIRVDEDDAPPSQTIGTPEFMAPEVLQAKAYNESADVYSYGCFVYELITLSVPWKGVTGFEEQVIAGRKPELQHITKLVYPTLSNLFLLCTAVATSKRPAMKDVIGVLLGAKAAMEAHDVKAPRSRTPVLDLQPPTGLSRCSPIRNRADRARSLCGL